MKQFVVVALLSGLIVSGAYAGKKDEVAKPQIEAVEVTGATDVAADAEKEKPGISIEVDARRDGFATTVISTCGAICIGAAVAGGEGACALGGLSLLANSILSFASCAKSETLKRNDPEASQSPTEQYDNAFADGQGLTAVAMAAAAYIGFIVYQAGHASGYWDGYAHGREAERAFAKYASSWYPNWCMMC